MDSPFTVAYSRGGGEERSLDDDLPCCFAAIAALEACAASIAAFCTAAREDGEIGRATDDREEEDVDDEEEEARGAPERAK